MSTTPTAIVQRVNSLSRVARSSSISPSRVRKQSFHESRAAQAIMMPALSPFMTEGTVTKWLKKEGEAFAANEVLLRIESDIASVDVQAEMPGVLGRILIPDGTTNVPVEQILAVVARHSPKDLPHLRPGPLPLPRIDVPPSPIRASRSIYPEIPTPISATSFFTAPSPRLPPESPNTPSLRRPTLHFHHPLATASRLESSQSNASFLHSATHRSPSAYEPPSASIVDSLLQPGSASVRGMIMDHHQNACPSEGICDSGSSVGCGASQAQASEAEGAGQNLRRKILASFSKGSSSKAEEYFDGIL